MSETFSRGYAVVVGVGADLPVTVDDAGALSQLLLDPARCAYPPDQVRLLTGEGARREAVLAALRWLAGAAGPGDTAVVYFSGHGVEVPGFHLLPYGYERQDLAGTAISGLEFTRALRAIEAQKLLVLLDCCHAGGQAEAKGAARSPLPPEAADELGRSSGRAVIASSRQDELSWVGQPYSQFTLAVLEALAGHGAFERDGFARVLDLALYVGRFVPERTDDKQHPIIKVSNLEDNFALAWYAGGDKTPRSLPWQAGPPVPVGAGDEAQVATWRRMLANYRDNLLLIEERMSEYVDFTEVPLQLVKSKRQTQREIEALESRLHQV